MLFTKFLLACCFLPSAPEIYAADAAPTLQETITSITEKLKDLPKADYEPKNSGIWVRYEISGMKVDGFNAGTLSVLDNETTCMESCIPATRLMRYQFPLSALSSNVQVMEARSPVQYFRKEDRPVAYGVVIASAPSAPEDIKKGAISTQRDGGKVESAAKVTLWFKSEETAKQVADAFHVAIELSGGK